MTDSILDGHQSDWKAELHNGTLAWLLWLISKKNSLQRNQVEKRANHKNLPDSNEFGLKS